MCNPRDCAHGCSNPNPECPGNDASHSAGIDMALVELDTLPALVLCVEGIAVPEGTDCANGKHCDACDSCPGKLL